MASSHVSKGPYTPKVSFGTSDNPQASMFSFSLQVQSAGYEDDKGVPVSSGFFKRIQEKSAEVDPDQKLSLILDYIPGKITHSIDRLIALYRPDSLVVGTRGRNSLLVTFAGIGSISKCVPSTDTASNVPVPAIVFRLERKLKSGSASWQELALVRCSGSCITTLSCFTLPSRLILASMTPRLLVNYSRIAFKGIDLNSKLVADSRANTLLIGADVLEAASQLVRSALEILRVQLTKVLVTETCVIQDERDYN
ncbi:hypothetical protein BKA70DRAFT_1475805 [Coprinopsis sp. MPI-PUGE-AT-0042]|nr:hypothetical protein BKA70DRAFT_1475805 [Coprinopsis sp. MPI-PUGE-AT-0042]